MTLLMMTLAAVYAASLCFVVTLLAGTLWRERATPLESATSILSPAAAHGSSSTPTPSAPEHGSAARSA